MATAPSNFGDKDVFTFEKGHALENQSIMNILKIAKKAIDKFNEKFDWTRTDGASYTPDGTPAVSGENVIPDTNVGNAGGTQQPEQQQEVKPPTKQPTFNFEDINF